MDIGGGTAKNAETQLYRLISQMKQDITIAVGTIMGGGVELPEDIINRYSAILRANIHFNKHVLPQQIHKLLSEILALPEVVALEPRRFNKVKGIRDSFYVNYTLSLNRLTKNEGHAVNSSAHFSLEPTIAEAVTNGHNAWGRVWDNNMTLLQHGQSRLVEPVVFDPTYGPLIANKPKRRRRRTKSANHKSGSNTRRKRSAP